MRSPWINGEGELRGQPDNLNSHEKWPLKRSVCVCTQVGSLSVEDCCLSVRLSHAWPLVENGRAQQVENWQEGSAWNGWPVTPFRGEKVKGQGHEAAVRCDRKSAISSEQKACKSALAGGGGTFWRPRCTELLYFIRNKMQPKTTTFFM